jgi:hypothetical protein
MKLYNVYFDGTLAMAGVSYSKAMYWKRKWAVTMPLAPVVLQRIE